MKKVLFISVHPDDETLGCGGTILKHKQLGDEIYWLILTKANQKITSIPNIVKIQKNFIKKVNLQYNFNGCVQLDFLTTELDRYPLGEIINSISKHINEIKPEYVYLNHFADIHSDHRYAFEAIYSCTKNFRYPFINKVLMYETLSETEFSPALRENAFIPNVFVDITNYIDKKLDIFSLYSTEVMPNNLPRSSSAIRSLAGYRGSRIGVEYAEAFSLLLEKTL